MDASFFIPVLLVAVGAVAIILTVFVYR